MIVGTAEYMPPEMLQGQGYGQATDYWAFGCLIYEMLVGQPPFMHQQKQSLYKLIKYTEPNYDFTFLTTEMIDLCQKLLHKDPLERLGSKNGALEVMGHPWFRDVDWNAI